MAQSAELQSELELVWESKGESLGAADDSAWKTDGRYGSLGKKNKKCSID